VNIDRTRRILLGRDLQIIFSITLISVIGVTSIAPAFPLIAKDLRLSESDVVMLITAFTLPGIFLSPVMGVLADRFGRKKVIVPSLFLFGIAGSACAFTGNFHLLLALRFLNGVGAAALGGLNQTVIGDMFTGPERAAALGYNASVVSIGTMAYPAIGGALALIGWNYPFLLSALALPVGVLVMLGLRNPEPGAVPPMRRYLAGAMSSVRGGGIVPAYLATMASFVLLYGAILAYFPFLMHARFGASSSTIGLMLAVTSITCIIGAFNLGRISRRFSYKTIITASFILYAVAICAIQWTDSIWLMIVPLLLYGFANGINIPGIQTYLSGNAPMEYRGVFMSMNSMVLRFGPTMGPILNGISFHRWGMKGVLYSSALFAAASFIILAVFLKDDGQK
jgi:ACDE family multidrug resistance protein